MIKEHIHSTDFAIILKFMLITNIGKTSSQLQQELLHFIDKPRFKFRF